MTPCASKGALNTPPHGKLPAATWYPGASPKKMKDQVQYTAHDSANLLCPTDTMTMRAGNATIAMNNESLVIDCAAIFMERTQSIARAVTAAAVREVTHRRAVRSRI